MFNPRNSPVFPDYAYELAITMSQSKLVVVPSLHSRMGAEGIVIPCFYAARTTKLAEAFSLF